MDFYIKQIKSPSISLSYKLFVLDWLPKVLVYLIVAGDSSPRPLLGNPAPIIYLKARTFGKQSKLSSDHLDCHLYSFAKALNHLSACAVRPFWLK
jgi:hypothetical protein